MKLLNKITLEIKKSKFIAFYYEVNDLDQILTILNDLKKER